MGVSSGEGSRATPMSRMLQNAPVTWNGPRQFLTQRARRLRGRSETRLGFGAGWGRAAEVLVKRSC